MHIHLGGNLVGQAAVSGSEMVLTAQVLALVFAAALSVLLAALGRSSRRNLYYYWAAAWFGYALSLAAAVGQATLAGPSYVAVLESVAVGLATLFLFAGRREMLEVPVEQPRVVLGLIAVVGAGCTAYALEGLGLFAILMLVGLGGAAALTGVLHDHSCQASRGVRLAAMGFGLWAIACLGTAAFPDRALIQAGAHLLATVAATVLALGLVVEREVVHSEEKYRSVLDSSRDALFIVDIWSLKVLDANEGAHRLTKRDLVAMIGSSFPEVCPDLKTPTSNSKDNRGLFAEVFKPYHEFHLVQADGSLVLCEGETSLVRWNDRAVVQVRIRKVAEARKIGQMVRRAEKMSSLGQLIAGVAHELNNPLAVVVGYAQVLSKQRLADEKVRNHVHHILHESERAAKIVMDLLSFARPCEPQLVLTDLNELVTNVLEIRSAELLGQGIAVCPRLAGLLPPTKVDPMQIEQVLNNLITNAMHVLSTHAGERVLTVATEEADFSLRIVVRDTGPGIKEEIIGKIFDPFFTTKPPGKGTGLGLSISHSILEEHHGRLTVESTYGHGAVFTLEVPLLTADEKPKDVDELFESLSHTVPEVAQTRLLVVDDEPGIREVLTTVLAEIGYQVDSAANGQQALDRLETCRYDLIISDMCMPEIDGERLFETLRARDPKLARRILFLTGDTVSIKSRSFLESTGNRWLSKPFDIRTLEQTVRSELGQQLVTIRTETGARVD